MIVSINIETLKFDVAIATSENLQKMAVLKERLNMTDMEKAGEKFWAMYQCIVGAHHWYA